MRVQIQLGEVYARLEAMNVMNWRMASDIEADQLDPALASAVKVYSTESLIEVYRIFQEILGVSGALRKGSAGPFFREPSPKKPVPARSTPSEAA